jgi:hypothetical protein
MAYYLEAAKATLIAAHPAAAFRLKRAARLVSGGAVSPVYGIGHLIASESDSRQSYWVQRVNDVLTCECADFRQRGGPCKHGWAVVLFTACERLDAEASDPTTRSDILPLPERAYSDEDRFELTAKGVADLNATLGA